MLELLRICLFNSHSRNVFSIDFTEREWGTEKREEEGEWEAKGEREGEGEGEVCLPYVPKLGTKFQPIEHLARQSY